MISQKVHYKELCQGCGHRTAMHLIDEIIEELNIKQKIIFALDVACCSLLIDDMPYDAIMCPHGRCIPVSIGMKSIIKNNLIINYMGDSAAYAIGLGELMNGAIRNNHLFNIIINNQVCAMTGGQVTPTSLTNQKTASTINGKSIDKYGEPFKIEKVLKNMNIGYLARASLNNAANINIAKNILKEGLNYYINNNKFSLIELISPCPTNFHMTIKDSYSYIENKVLKEYEIGVFNR